MVLSEWVGRQRRGRGNIKWMQAACIVPTYLPNLHLHFGCLPQVTYPLCHNSQSTKYLSLFLYYKGTSSLLAGWARHRSTPLCRVVCQVKVSYLVSSYLVLTIFPTLNASISFRLPTLVPSSSACVGGCTLWRGFGGSGGVSLAKIG